MVTTPPARAKRTTRSSADETRRRILAAAVDTFATQSFDGASTREIAALAGVSQPSLNYHFHSKFELWQAAVDGLFGALATVMTDRLHGLRGVDERTRAELMVREFIAFSAAHPQLHRIITQESKADNERMDWLVDHHVRQLYELTTGLFADLIARGEMPDIPTPSLFYILTGAGPTIFVHAPECRRLTGQDPLLPDAVQAHADAVVRLLFG